MTDTRKNPADSGPANDDGSIFDALEAEAAEEQHLDERAATGEHHTGGSDDFPEADSL